ncbi:sprouty-related, EVH1 domain-containing protein 2 isoform X2 [Plutella xylostella]|uniref:sprouty-related, EVH1 domain-containing protein 2 isoform X2 n=1 Tax=Plutella xylostella TaxID=51655 RepID=UPI002032A012|nr:sprouty-related, EVH1 domain-containing protein 2 isoform X2 [Plutella xylostella]
MTEGYEETWLVRVRAQVMCRDEATGGWLALGGGGLANVCVGKRKVDRAAQGAQDGDEASASTSAPAQLPRHSPDGFAPPPREKYEYFIHGVRISDDTEVLSCTIKKDFQYNKVMPTFHHWVTDDKRYGLTFQTAADARAFDRGVRTAIEELLQGLGGAWPCLHAYKVDKPEEEKERDKEREKEREREEDEEGNIFECLNLPSESRSSSEGSSAARERRLEDINQTPILSAITLPRHSPRSSLKRYGGSGEGERMGAEDGSSDHCAYVQLSAHHEYTYPQVPGSGSPNTKPPLMRKDSGSMKKRAVTAFSDPPPLPDKKPIRTEQFQARLKCRHCHEWYLESANRPGACEFSPDRCRSCVDTVTCIKCAQCLLYHCMSDSEGDYNQRPCACDEVTHNCAKRWLGLALLSILVPCLCCYAPLKCMHRAARAAHLAGGSHSPQ